MFGLHQIAIFDRYRSDVVKRTRLIHYQSIRLNRVVVLAVFGVNSPQVRPCLHKSLVVRRRIEVHCSALSISGQILRVATIVKYIRRIGFDCECAVVVPLRGRLVARLAGVYAECVVRAPMGLTVDHS